MHVNHNTNKAGVEIKAVPFYYVDRVVVYF